AILAGQYHVPLALVLSFMAPCHGQTGVCVGCTVLGSAGAWALSHSDACSTCVLTLAKSTPRDVTSTSCPCRLAFSVMLTGASGRGAGVGCGCAGSAWPFVPALSFCCTSACARFCMPAAILCLHQPEGACGKSLQSHSPLTKRYTVVPLDCEATRALPSASNSTSPA